MVSERTRETRHVRRVVGVGASLLKGLGLIGVCLCALNVYGSIVSLRAPNIQGLLKDDLTLSYAAVMVRKDREPGELPAEYLYRLTSLINRSMAHIWDDSVTDLYHLRVPIWENFVLYQWSFVVPQRYEKYEFSDYRKALERGVGLCSQQSLVLADILNENGVKADLVGLEGHVVVRAEVSEGRWFIADTDYGIIMPFDLPFAEQHPELVRKYHRDIDLMYVVDNPARVYKIPAPSFTEYLTMLYGSEGNRIFRGGTSAYVPDATREFEVLAYRLKWLIPFLLVVPQGIAWIPILKGLRKRLAALLLRMRSVERELETRPCAELRDR